MTLIMLMALAAGTGFLNTFRRNMSPRMDKVCEWAIIVLFVAFMLTVLIFKMIY